MSTHLFVNTETKELVNYEMLKAHPSFDNFEWNWAKKAVSPLVDYHIELYNAPFMRFYETPKPECQPWETVIHSNEPSYNVLNQVWERVWIKRNLTQEELDQTNELRKEHVRLTRSNRLSEEADPLFFKTQRGEVEPGVWEAKVEEIRNATPYPEPIVIPT